VTDANRIAVGVVAFLLAMMLLVWLVFMLPNWGKGEPETGTMAVSEPAPKPEPTPTLQERLSERLQGTTLSTSDAVIRELTEQLSSRPELASWLVNEDLVRRFVASVENVAEGSSPRQHLEFMAPSRPFEVQERGDRLIVAPASYDRYDQVAAVIDSLDPEGTVALYRELKPLIDDAFAEIAPPGATFDDRLDEALDELLAVPVLSGDVEVEQKVVTYTYADPRLEGMTAAQRQLLRMGPANVAKIQAKIRELRAAGL
jgi:hypothetical protein